MGNVLYMLILCFYGLFDDSKCRVGILSNNACIGYGEGLKTICYFMLFYSFGQIVHVAIFAI